MPQRTPAIVPVIDLKRGLAVRARAGERDSYAPIVSPLSATADPVEVARGLLAAVPADILYVADLDAIEGGARDLATLRRLAEACPEVDLWIDAGFSDDTDVAAFVAAGLGTPVLGSENQTSPDLVRRLGDHAVLSLDFRGDKFMGPPALIDDPSAWPSRVIVMTLARVGTRSGPDLARLSDIRGRAPGARVYAAGGLRGPDDLAPLAGLGIAGVLVASAIHDGRLTAASLSGSSL